MTIYGLQNFTYHFKYSALCTFIFLLTQVFYCIFKLYKFKATFILAIAWDFQQCGMCNQQRLRSACAYAQSDQSLCLSLEYSMSVKLLTNHLLDVLSLKGGCTCSSKHTLVKMPLCWKSHVTAHFINNMDLLRGWKCVDLDLDSNNLQKRV